MALTNSVKGTLAVLAATLAGTAIAGCGAQHGTSSGSAAMVAPEVPRRPAVVPEQRSAPATHTPRPVRATPTVPVPKARSAAVAPSRKHRGEGRASAPLGRASTSDLIEHAAEGGGRTVALTFDDGPDPRWTPQILRLLAQHHAKATFCEIGPNARANPGLVKRITAAGHRLCDHSVHHDEQQSHKSVDYNRHEIVDAQRDIAAAAAAGRFTVDDPKLAMAVAAGVLLGLGKLLQDEPERDDAAAADRVTEDLLRLFGLPADEAHEICTRTLPDLDDAGEPRFR